jgi:acetyl-CoA acetyltransferase family protein
MGETAENVAEKWKITREEQDTFALESQRKAGAAIARGAFEKEIAKVTLPGKKGAVTVVDKDEGVRADTTLEALAALPAVFRKNGTVTAGNSSPLNDGASAVMVVSEAVLTREKLTPLARVVAFATAGVEPNFMGEGPIPATRRALSRAGWKIGDIDQVELNEAFAAQAIPCQRALEIDPARLNPDGGAIALGHPIGSSGCRLLVTLAHSLVRNDRKRGLAALCIGVGQGIAMLIERA